MSVRKWYLYSGVVLLFLAGLLFGVFLGLALGIGSGTDPYESARAIASFVIVIFIFLPGWYLVRYAVSPLMHARNTLVGAVLMIVILSGAVGYFFNANTYANDALYRSRVKEASMDAHEIRDELYIFMSVFYEDMYELYEVFESEGFDNETRDYIVRLMRENLEDEAERSWRDVEGALDRLDGFVEELPFFNRSSYLFLKSVIHETLQQIQTIGLGRSIDAPEEIALLQELYDLIDIDGAVYDRRVKLYGMASCFHELSRYWELEERYGRNIPSGRIDVSPEQLFDWIIGNATTLHNDLIQWDEYHEPRDRY